MDLFAENIIKKNIESNSYSWVDGQRNLVILSMQEYSNQQLAEYKEKLKKVIDKTNIDDLTKAAVKAIADHLEDL